MNQNSACILRICRRTMILAVLFYSFLGLTVSAQEYLSAAPENLQWFREARFGLFVHWGPVSLEGTEIGWSRGGERRGTGGTGQIPVAVYDNLYKKFNPVRFNAREWVDMAKAAGMKYLVFTTKHHDGFCMFDTKLSEYKITNSPFGRDIVSELAKACYEGGIRLGFYYSPPDWHHEYYRNEQHPKYIEFLHGQIRELCTNYGQLDIMWFDGLGGSAEDWNSKPLFKMIRELQPMILINNRAGLPADFDTPEQTVGRFQTDRAWESCITICNQWAWKPNDELKSLKRCIQTLVGCAGGDGNLLFNVGPMPDGRIEPRQVERLKQMGDWLRLYGDSIYGTRGGPYEPQGNLYCTHKDKTIYLHVLERPEGPFEIPPMKARIVSASLLTGGEVNVKQSGKSIRIDITEQSRQYLDTIVALQLDRPAAEAQPAQSLWGESPANGKPARASNVYQNQENYGPEKALDGNHQSRWATDSGTHSAWLEVDLGAPMKVGRAALDEAFNRVEVFSIEYLDGEVWKSCLEGTTIGSNQRLQFKPVKAQRFRLNILKASEGPTINEWGLFPPE